ncbi:MAG: ferrous iron transport protein A [Flavobacteriaceae bacterium]|jgi:ferrous iron transport protein A|nr:ferrous iron transport protein A [Flavobacteriaceae bacterium]
MNPLETLSQFPKRTKGIIKGYADSSEMPTKIMEMGLLPETKFMILHQAPFGGPMYVEFGKERSRLELRQEEAEFIVVEKAI